MTARNHRIFALLAAILMMLACAPTFAPVSAPLATFDPNSINTVIVQTAEAAATQTALMLPPTWTPTATLIPTSTLTETPTPTFIFTIPTLTLQPTLATPGSSGLAYECQIIMQTPANNTAIPHSSTFDARWMVVNIGKKFWSANDADYRYISGEKMHITSAFDLNKSVASGGTIELVAPMRSPAGPGTYTTTWKITVGKERFCPMSITIVVN